MFSLIAFLLGIYVLFKGRFRLFGREIAQRQARTIGFVLVAPLAIQFCAAVLLAPQYVQYVQFTADGSVAIDPAAVPLMAQLGVVEWITLIIAVGYSALTIFSTPQTEEGVTPSPQRSTAPLTPQSQTPNILTVPEAAAYLRVSEEEILRLIEEGQLGAVRFGDSYRIARIALDNFMSAV